MGSLLNEEAQPRATHQRGQARRNTRRAQTQSTWHMPSGCRADSGGATGVATTQDPPPTRAASCRTGPGCPRHHGQRECSSSITAACDHCHLEWSAVDQKGGVWHVITCVHTDTYIHTYVRFKIVSFVAKYHCKLF